MTTIFDLPRDLEEEILSRLTLKSMRAVRLTCRKWDTLSQSRSFTKKHIGKKASAAREGESQMIVMIDNDVHLMSFFDEEGDPSKEHKGKLSCVNENEQDKISQVFHCEGLLLCILKDHSRFVVWNPYWGQTRWIEPRYSHGYNGWYRYALGYVNKKKKSCRSHKILRFFDEKIGPSGNIHALIKRFQLYEIYDFDSDLWKTLDVPSHWFVSCYQRGVSLKGNTYFCATKTNSKDKLDDHLLCFDFTSERFGRLLPFPFSAERGDYVTLSCVREEKLAVLLTHIISYELNIWITTKIESKKVSWSKFLTLDTEPDYRISPFEGFFIDEKKKVAMGFDWYHHHVLNIVGEAKYLRKLVLRDKISTGSASVCSYVPSLVQIKQPARGKRKKQSNLQEEAKGENEIITKP